MIARTLAALVGLSLTCLACSTANDDGAARTVVSGSDRRPSQTVTDWVTYADFVVVASAKSEKETSSTDEASEEGSVLRNVSLDVDQVIWTNPKMGLEPPTQLDWVAFGWTYHGDERKEMVGEGAPRIEKGHRYVIAIYREEARCSEGDRSPARWLGLGSDSMIPFDTETLGDGENMGEDVQASDALATISPDNVDFSFEDEMTGKSLSELTFALQGARAVEKEVFDRPAPCQ